MGKLKPGLSPKGFPARRNGPVLPRVGIKHPKLTRFQSSFQTLNPFRPISSPKSAPLCAGPAAPVPGRPDAETETRPEMMADKIVTMPAKVRRSVKKLQRLRRRRDYE